MFAPNIVFTTDAITDNTAVFSKASSITQLVSTVFTHYQELLRVKLQSVYNLAFKAFRVCQALLSFEKHKAMGTFPSAILSLKVPIVQCSAEYIAGGTANDESKGRDSIVEKAKGFALASFITTKKNESSYLTTQCSPTVTGERITARVDAVWQELVTILGS